MIELDYAFLADYTVVENGRLTAVGASYTHIEAPVLPAPHNLSIGGRIRISEDVEGVNFGLLIAAPEHEYEITGSSVLMAGPEGRPYDGKIGILFSVATTIMLTRPGLYTVELSLEGEHVRRLAFDVGTA